MLLLRWALISTLGAQITRNFNPHLNNWVISRSHAVASFRLLAAFLHPSTKMYAIGLPSLQTELWKRRWWIFHIRPFETSNLPGVPLVFPTVVFDRRWLNSTLILPPRQIKRVAKFHKSIFSCLGLEKTGFSRSTSASSRVFALFLFFVHGRASLRRENLWRFFSFLI